MIKILVGHKCDDEESKRISLEEGQAVHIYIYHLKFIKWTIMQKYNYFLICTKNEKIKNDIVIYMYR